MPVFRTCGQELPLWKGLYFDRLSVSIPQRGQVMPFLAAKLWIWHTFGEA
jgi:hypothetical protein